MRFVRAARLERERAEAEAASKPWAPETPLPVQRVLAAVQEAFDAIKGLYPEVREAPETAAILRRGNQLFEGRVAVLLGELAAFRYDLWSAHHPITM